MANYGKKLFSNATKASDELESIYSLAALGARGDSEKHMKKYDI